MFGNPIQKALPLDQLGKRALKHSFRVGAIRKCHRLFHKRMNFGTERKKRVF